MTDLKVCTKSFPSSKCIKSEICDKSLKNCTHMNSDGTVMYLDKSDCCYIPKWGFITGNHEQGGYWIENKCGKNMYNTGQEHKFSSLGRTYVECSPNKEQLLEEYCDNNKIYPNFSGVGIY